MERRHGIHVSFDQQGVSSPLDDNTKALLFDCVREILFNAVKYSGVDTVGSS